MKSARTTTIHAADLMQADVATVTVDDSMESAVRILEDLHISGLPVLDDAGKLAGVFSETDLERFLREQHEEGADTPAPADWDDEVDGENPPVASRHPPALLGKERVGDWMSPSVISVAPTATLREVCRSMSRENVHRVLVAREGKLLGIITSFDVVRCLANLD